MRLTKQSKKSKLLSIEETSGSGEGWKSGKIFWKFPLLISLKQAHELSRWKRGGGGRARQRGKGPEVRKREKVRDEEPPCRTQEGLNGGDGFRGAA